MKLKMLIFFTILLLIISASILLLNLYEFIKNDTIMIHRTVKVKANDPINLEVDVNRFDRVYLIVGANTIISEVFAEPKGVLIPLPLDVEGFEHDVAYPIILQRGFFYIANSSGQVRITIVPQYQIPYAIKVCEGKVNAKVLKDDQDEGMILDLRVEEFATTNYSQTLLVHRFDEVIDVDFQVGGTIKLLEGRIAYVNFILMTENGIWYAFRITPMDIRVGETVTFNVDVSSKELLGRNFEFLGRKTPFIAFGIGLYSGQWESHETPFAKVSIGDLYIRNHGEERLIKALVLDEYDLELRTYIFRKFSPTFIHIMLVTALASEVTALLYLSLRWLKHEEDKSLNDHD